MIILLSIFLPLTTGVFFDIPGHTEKCFREFTIVGSEVHGSYVVSGRADYNVRAIVTNPDDEIIYKSPYRSREGNFVFHSERGGYYKVCFKSIDGKLKTVNFEFSVKNKENNSVAKHDELQPLLKNLNEMENSLERVKNNIKFYQRREAVHRDLTENTCDWVLRSAFLKLVALVLISSVQIYLIKKSIGGKEFVV
ncbi:unnamed protein product [Blepharisma stoltei]|uniref:GOLD domain-containing protein n=1 Tax=Blepharisma stoltei TaxID=1481888 RepID=A0AAU9IA10_9CILI|nr:unnamed protein product [Blepharisma stoltei]